MTWSSVGSVVEDSARDMENIAFTLTKNKRARWCQCLFPPETSITDTVTTVGNSVRFNNNLMRVFHGRLGPHADGPSGSRSFDYGVVGLGGSLAVKIEYLTDGVGTLEHLDLRFAGSLSRVLGPPHNLNGFDIVGNGESFYGSESTFWDCTLHGVLGVRVPNVVLEGDERLRAVKGWNLGTECAWEFLRSSGWDLKCLLSLGESKHSLERSLGSVLEIHVHGVQETNRSFPTVEAWSMIGNISKEREKKWDTLVCDSKLYWIELNRIEFNQPFVRKSSKVIRCSSAHQRMHRSCA